jgi:hypothetical protein
MRRLSIPLVGALALVLTGCQVPDVGDLAFGRNEAGKPIAVVHMCEGAVDSVIVYNSDADVEQTWDFDENVAGYGTLTLDGLDTDLDSGRSYSSFAGSSDDSASARGPRFRLTDLADLEPGEVLAVDPDNVNGAAVMSEDEFRAIAKSDCS